MRTQQNQRWSLRFIMGIVQRALDCRQVVANVYDLRMPANGPVVVSTPLPFFTASTATRRRASMLFSSSDAAAIGLAGSELMSDSIGIFEQGGFHQHVYTGRRPDSTRRNVCSTTPLRHRSTFGLASDQK